MAKQNDLKNIVLDAMMEFYQEYIKPETRTMVEEVTEETIERKLKPIKNAIITLNKNVTENLATHERRITNLETTLSN